MPAVCSICPRTSSRPSCTRIGAVPCCEQGGHFTHREQGVIQAALQESEQTTTERESQQRQRFACIEASCPISCDQFHTRGKIAANHLREAGHARRCDVYSKRFPCCIRTLTACYILIQRSGRNAFQRHWGKEFLYMAGCIARERAPWEPPQIGERSPMLVRQARDHPFQGR